MDYSQMAELNQSLIFLRYSIAIGLIVVVCFLIPLIINLIKLSKNLNETSILLNTELKPTLQELSQALKTVNELVQSTDKGVDNVKLVVDKLINKTKTFSQNVFDGFLKGFATIIGLFKK